MVDPKRKTPRQFQCRDYLWELYTQMGQDLDCSVDYLVNEAMRQYARTQHYLDEQGRIPGTSALGGAAGGGSQARPAPTAGSHAGVAPVAAVRGDRADDSARLRATAPSSPPPGGSPAVPPSVAPSAGVRTPGQSYAPTFPPPPPGPSPSPSAGPPPPLPGSPVQASPVQASPVQAPPVPVPSAQGGGARPPMEGHPSKTQPSRNIPGPPAGGARGQAVAPPPPAALQLSVLYNGQKVAVSQEEFVIGRSSKTSDLVIKDGNISRRHAIVVFEGGTYYIRDLGSTNGVEFEGRRVDQKAIHEGDRFVLCDYEIQFTYR